VSLRAIARGAPGTLWRRIYTVKNPGAGNDVTFPIPAHRAWELLGVAALLTPSGVAGNRRPVLTLRDSGNVTLAAVASPTLITAAQVTPVTWTNGQGAPVVVGGTAAWLPLPDDWYMMPSESLTVTGHTDPGDTWTNIRVTVLEVNTGDPAYVGSLERQVADHLEALYELTH
jgi:hypothetical protein